MNKLLKAIALIGSALVLTFGCAAITEERQTGDDSDSVEAADRPHETSDQSVTVLHFSKDGEPTVVPNVGNERSAGIHPNVVGVEWSGVGPYNETHLCFYQNTNFTGGALCVYGVGSGNIYGFIPHPIRSYRAHNIYARLSSSGSLTAEIAPFDENPNVNWPSADFLDVHFSGSNLWIPAFHVALDSTNASAPLDVNGQPRPNPSAMCLDVRAANNANGTPVQLWPCDTNGANANQNWRYDGPTQTIRVFPGPNVKCLDAYAPSSHPAQGALLQIWDCIPGQQNQKWNVVDQDVGWPNGGRVSIFNIQPAGYSSYCLDTVNATLGQQLRVWSCNAGSTQIVRHYRNQPAWTFIGPGRSAP